MNQQKYFIEIMLKMNLKKNETIQLKGSNANMKHLKK